jgi:hypothetical protein
VGNSKESVRMKEESVGWKIILKGIERKRIGGHGLNSY